MYLCIHYTHNNIQSHKRALPFHVYKEIGIKYAGKPSANTNSTTTDNFLAWHDIESFLPKCKHKDAI